MPGDTPLDVLHDVIRIAFGWEHSHPHQFEAEGRQYTDTSHGAAPGVSDERRATLVEFAPRKGHRLRYPYDLGDARVACLAAERAGPPEDSGGIPGYQNLLDARSDPEHPEHDHCPDWLGGIYDPVAVDRDAINIALAKVGVPVAR
ncbi:MAG: hypothetical protein GEV28_06155 [Actinophytocola sp.]|uniref:plasmid pRiA4b ORF-3 family protein n=1 Tax=Actinophytocola sp. TaxID=1872138 RepID=UPI001325017B|nr:plasmid pRiA4b ORF-3 family protein [Actinophytocola sp.]MPZ79992.1 hypothetical protein [Actinophytocola sp.]